MRGTNDCKDFDFEKKVINWSNEIMQSKEEMEYFIKEFEVDFE